MSAIELILRVLAQLRPALPALITAIVLTLAASIGLAAYVHGVWVQEKRFSLGGLFFGLDRTDAVRLSCAWLRLIFLLVFLICFQKLELLHYEMLLIPSILFSVTEKKLMRAGTNLLWAMLDLLGLLSANLVCGYVLDMNGGMGFVLLYVAMALFLALFNIYLFLNELDYISDQRSVDPEQIWGGKAGTNGT